MPFALHPFSARLPPASPPTPVSSSSPSIHCTCRGHDNINGDALIFPQRRHRCDASQHISIVSNPKLGNLFDPSSKRGSCTEINRQKPNLRDVESFNVSCETFLLLAITTLPLISVQRNGCLAPPGGARVPLLLDVQSLSRTHAWSLNAPPPDDL